MPPKKTQAKKGPTYKIATPLKDILPPSAKEPRQSKPCKVPDTFPEPNPKNQPDDTLPVFFADWPSEQALKTYDFGNSSQETFNDEQHSQIIEYLKKQLESSVNEVEWKRFEELELLRQKRQQNEEEEMQFVEDQNTEKTIGKQQQDHQRIQKSPNQELKTEENKKNIVVIQTFMREETEEETERRKRDEAEKAEKAAKEKKKGKKQQPKEEGPIQVSDVQMANVYVKRHMCPSGIWIGSQLQIIKARKLKDIYSQNPVWKNIHPQQNGVPQITKSGKYWVKLYYMGKPVKVEIDDRIPVDLQYRELFPTSEKENQKWTFIMSKALIKYFSLVCPKETIIGSGLIMYALTGLISENVPLRGFNGWQKLEDFMSNQHYKEKDIILSCFSSDGTRKNPSNFIRSAQDIKGIVQLENSTFKKRSKKRISDIDANLIKKVRESEEADEVKVEETFIDNLVVSRCAYSIGDYFSTDGFNMVFSKEKSGTEQRLRLDYNEMSKVSLTNKTRDEKLEHRRKKKEIKERLLAEEKKRVDEISKPLVNYHFLKLLGNININCEYSNREILLAKKCVLNNISQPPNYEIPSSEAKEELKSSVSQIKFKEDSQVNIPLDDFGSLEDAKELFDRPDQGVWIKHEDLLSTFDEIQIFYNPNIFQYKAIEEISHQCPEQFSYDESKQILVLQKKGNPHEEGQKMEQKEEIDSSTEEIKLLFGFSFQDSKWDTLSSPYCMLQKFDFDAYRTTNSVTTLSKILSSTYLNLPNQNSVFKIYSMSKGRYAYWISSTSPYKLLSIAEYLTEYQAYSSQNFTVEYGPLEEQCYQTLFRIKIRHEGDENNAILLKMKNCPKEVEKYLNYKLVAIPNSGVYTSEEAQGIIKTNTDNLLMCYEYSRAELSPATTYYLLVQAYPSCNIPDGSFELTILSKQSDITIQQIEQIEPYKFVEKYQPNKYANIFRERLFCNSPANVSLVFRVVEGEEGQPVATDKKASKKGGKDEPTFEIIEKPLSEKRLFHVKILKNGNLVYYAKGYNEIILSNITIEKTKDEGAEYFIEAFFDLRDWPEASANNEYNNKIFWTVQISGEDPVAFAKDTLKEDKEKETRKSWEDNQPGRAEKSKRARQKYLLELKRDRGQELTEQEQSIVNAPRLTKKQLLEEEKKNQDKKGGKGAKKDDKKGAKKQEIVEEKKEERPLPKSSDNFMTQIKGFLKNLESFQVKTLLLENGKNPTIRSEEEQKSIKQGAMMAKQNRTAQIVRNVEMRETMKIKEKDKRDKLTILLEDSRNSFIADWKKYIAWRTSDQEKDLATQQKEKAVIGIIRQDNQTISEADLEKMLGEYRSLEGHNPKLADVGERIKKNIKIGGMVEKMNNLLAGWEVEELKTVLQEVKNQKMEGIDQEVMSKVKEMLEEAERNPALVAEKQAELKKGGKKGGKK